MPVGPGPRREWPELTSEQHLSNNLAPFVLSFLLVCPGV